MAQQHSTVGCNPFQCCPYLGSWAQSILSAYESVYGTMKVCELHSLYAFMGDICIKTYKTTRQREFTTLWKEMNSANKTSLI